MTIGDGQDERIMSEMQRTGDVAGPGLVGRSRPTPRGIDVEPVPGLTVRVLDTGWMELGHPSRCDRLLCDEVGTAMWLALCRTEWNLGDAAAHLADLWDTDPWAMRDMMDDWLDELREAGLVRY